ncbi:trihelix transcription factor GT-3b-like isoform X1 [Curcuma longa]|uniref:trihelix transcription factor GT-3b-like isoform X1 n=1 Tax=Curcuma longa TaxID=136217 RepID=UPI003D9EAFB5
MEHHLRHLLNPYQTLNPGTVAAAQDPDGGGGGGATDQRLPQWSHEETRELLAIRAQLDKSFTETKRNKPLWEATSSLLLLKGFSRTPDQCKSKWKNLVTRFKQGSESLTESEKQHFPFYEEMRRIFSDREAAPPPSEKGKQAVLQVEELDEKELASEELEEEEESGKTGRRKKRKLDRQVAAERSKPTEAINVAVREFMRRQMEMEARWLEATESREAARRAEQEEWRRLMEGLRAERAEMDRRWREREEERRAREEARAERRHQLLVTLLDKLISQKD